MKIKKLKFEEEIIKFKNSRTYQYFKKAYFDIDEYLKTIEIQKDEFDIQQILPEYDLGVSDFYKWSVKTMIMAKFALNSAISFFPENIIIEGNYKLNSDPEKNEIIFGNLTVNGDFINEGRLVGCNW